MPSQITNYKCPTCTGPLHFVGESGKLECDYCGGAFDVAEIEALYADKDKAAAEAKTEADKKAEAQKAAGDQWDTSGSSTDWGADGEGMKVYNCPSCGAELICDETTAATSCPYCNNPTIVPGQFGGILKPDYVIPFKLDKEQAKAALRSHYKGKKLLPKSFSDTNHIEEIRGVYVPFWLFDGEADANVTFEATNSRSYRRGKYQITETDHYELRREGTVSFERIPVDASSKMPDAHMDSIEPYDYTELKEFSTAYLPGFLADKYDVTVDSCSKRADERAASTAVDVMAASAGGYQTCLPVSQDVRLRRGRVRYALMPVWMLNTKWNGKDFLFAMNGQTGRMVGDLPVSMGKFWAWFAGIFVPLAAVFGYFFLA